MSKAISIMSPSLSSGDVVSAHENDELDVEVAALLAGGAQDLGEPTEAVHLDTLSEAEKRVLLALLRKRVGHSPTSPDSVSEIGQP